jgi:uncharacterized SAM-binding protein YcdF (DUF218 family)
LPEADAIVVLGCSPSPRLERRLERGVQLYRQGVAPVLLMSGGGSGPVSEAEIMRRMALASGVPDSAVLIEPSSYDTLENARNTARLLRSRGWQTVVLVSDRTHLCRATLLFRLAHVSVVARSGVRARPPLKEIGTAIREMAALPRSLFRALAADQESRRRRPTSDG